MHELGIVFHIIDSVIAVANENKVKHINKVTLEIGEVSGIVNAYLEDCWKWAVTKNPITLNCVLKIEVVKAMTFCNSCQQTYETIKHGKTCPFCGSEDTFLSLGSEVSIKEIEVI